MSAIDERKEQIEHQCLLDAYNFCINNPVPQQTKEILKYLNGEHLIRDKNDSPDIINICSRNHGLKSLVGIEHFNVGSISKVTSTGKTISLHQLHKNNLLKINEEMNREKRESGSISKEVLSENIREVGSLVEDALNGTYEAYIHSFQTAWEKHISRIEKYTEQVSSLAEEIKINHIEIAFLIEIDSEFHDWFYNHSDGKKEYDNTGLMPVFKKIISIINSTSNLKKLNYIVFYNKVVNKSNQSVIAFRTGSVKSNLQKQGIPVYDFLGESGCKLVIDNIEQSVDEIIPEYHFNGYTNEHIRETLFPLYRKAKSFSEKHIPFVASRSVQHLLYIDPDNCSGKEEILRKSKQFSKMYSINNEE